MPVVAVIAQDIHATLSAALTVPVLSPEQIETPNQGAKKGEKGGIPGYFARSAPDGYIQVENAQGIGAGVPTETYWIPVAFVAPTRAQCVILAQSALQLLTDPTGRNGARYAVVIPDQAREVQSGVWLQRPTLQAVAIAGQLT